jgi:hypothetical protein
VRAKSGYRRLYVSDELDRLYGDPPGPWNPAPRRDSRTPTLPTNRNP